MVRVVVVATFKDMVRFIGFNSYFCSYNYHLREDNRLNNNTTINIVIVKIKKGQWLICMNIRLPKSSD